MRFCEKDGCNQPVFSTCKISRKGYCRSHQYLKESFDRRSIVQKAIEKHKTKNKPQQAPKTTSPIHSPQETEIGEGRAGCGLNSAIEYVSPAPESYDGVKNDYIRHDEVALFGSGVDESLSNLSSDLDYVLSLYIRYKYADKHGMVKCFTCPAVLPIKEIQNGHYIKRGNRATRFLEINCHPQCPTCNQDHNYDETPYTNALEAEHPGITTELKQLEKIVYKASKTELKQSLIEYRAKLEILKTKITHASTK